MRLACAGRRFGRRQFRGGDTFTLRDGGAPEETEPDEAYRSDEEDVQRKSKRGCASARDSSFGQGLERDVLERTNTSLSGWDGQGNIRRRAGESDLYEAGVESESLADHEVHRKLQPPGQGGSSRDKEKSRRRSKTRETFDEREAQSRASVSNAFGQERPGSGQKPAGETRIAGKDYRDQQAKRGAAGNEHRQVAVSATFMDDEYPPENERRKDHEIEKPLHQECAKRHHPGDWRLHPAGNVLSAKQFARA
jgi:hypothetical protein